jgi:mannose/fructose/N-acetylgalactosamine-specific phosphotransferase system component IID
MILIAFAWLYVVLMVAVVEATGSDGTVLGAIVTFILYGVLPLGIVLYLMLSPARRSARRAAEALEALEAAVAAPASTAAAGTDPDQRGHAAGDVVAAERKEP